MRSITIPKVTTLAKETNAFKNKKCKNLEAKDYADSYLHNKVILPMVTVSESE